MVRLRRWSGANSCIPQHILDRLVSSNYKFLNTTCLQSQKEVLKKNLALYRCINSHSFTSSVWHHVSVRIVPGKTTTNSSFASRQQKSISSLMSFRQDRSSFTCNRQMKLHTPISRCHYALPHLTECVVLTDHYKHGTLRPAGASDAADSLQLLPAYIGGLS